MKSISLLLLMMALSVFAETHDTNAKLPEDKLIWPLPKVELGPNTIKIEASFLNQKKIVSYSQGNRVKVIYLVTYKLKSDDERFLDGKINFIVKSFGAAKGSGIKDKRLRWHFTEGDKTFFLEKDEGVTFRTYYNIISYTP